MSVIGSGNCSLVDYWRAVSSINTVRESAVMTKMILCSMRPHGIIIIIIIIIILLFSLALQPSAGYGLLVHEVS
jgi:hypothetical protein